MPMRLSELEVLAKSHGIDLVPGKGSHMKFVATGARPFPVPAHNGKRSEISDQYIKRMWANFGIKLGT